MHTCPLIGLDGRILEIPFRHSFRHASAVRDQAAALWVTASGFDGLVGYGEGCPREYVTGESVRSALIFIEQYRESLLEIVRDLGSLKEWMLEHHDVIEINPAAWCAIELALLDLMAQSVGQPVEDFLGLPRLHGPYIYTAVIGVTSAEKCAVLLSQYKKLKIVDFKLKLSGNLESDRANLALVRTAGAERLRVDANNLWSDLGSACDYLEQLNTPLFAVEEPFKVGQFDLMSKLAEICDTRIILDESVNRREHLDSITSDASRWIVNLRVSKMGGLLRSLDVIKDCRTRQLPVIIGAQVGETSLLTRAALTLANATRDILLAQEGAFGTYLLDYDMCSPELKFGVGGRLDIDTTGIAERLGFGLQLS
ncbi:MAG: hypothetical protein HY940_05610 [Gammaproteobacteria bacterium]|nr:hypothetical protein [Gammaproteobacteria bacterium]